MPPAGVTFKLKPPPTPVLLPSRPKKRRPAAAEEEDDLGLGDLGLGDLGIDLEGALEGAAPAEGAEAAEPAEPAEGVTRGTAKSRTGASACCCTRRSAPWQH